MRSISVVQMREIVQKFGSHHYANHYSSHTAQLSVIDLHL